MKTPSRAWLLPSFVLALLSPALRAGDDEAAIKKLQRPGVRVVRQETALVELHTLGTRDEDLAGFARFRSLRVLGLSNSQVTDAGLRQLAGMDSLQVLHLYNSRKITGKGLKEIARNKNLKELWLDVWQINDEGLIALGKAGKLHTLLQARSGDRWAAGDAEVRILSLQTVTVTEAGLKGLRGLTSLEAIYLYGPNFSDQGMKDLAALPTLRVLALGGAHVTVAGLREIAGLKFLEALHISGARITDAGMKVIGGFKSLHTLCVDSPAVTGAGVRQLAGLPLHTFDPGRSLTDAHLHALAAINRLHALSEARTERGERPAGPGQVFSLSLAGQPVTGAGLKALKGLTSFQILRLERTRVAGQDLVELAALPALGVVAVDNGLITDATLGLLRRHDLLHILASETRRGGPAKTLPWLNLENQPITDRGLGELAGIRSLARLYLGHTGVADAGLKVLATLPSLHTLRLNDTRVTDAGLKELARIPTLGAVALDNTRVTAAGLRAFAGHKSLHTIGLAPRQVNDATLRVLRENKMLHLLSAARASTGDRPRSDGDIAELVLSRSGVTDAGLRELAGLQALETLNLHGTRVTDRAVESLRKDLPRLQEVIR